MARHDSHRDPPSVPPIDQSLLTRLAHSCARADAYQALSTLAAQCEEAKEQAVAHPDASAGLGLLHWAAYGGSREIVAALLSASKDPGALRAAADDSTALHTAARCGRHRVAKLLVERSPRLLYARDCTGSTPLHDACANGHERVARQLLLAAGALANDDTDPPLLLSMRTVPTVR